MTRSKLKTFAFAGAVATLAALAAAATAAPPSPGAVIAARHANFEKMGKAMKALNGELKNSPPSKPAMVAAAQALASAAREQPRLFPAGSGPSSGAKTDALANIWTDRATFDGMMNKLVVESGKLVAAANGGNAAAIQAQFKATGATCAACHRQFRADN